MYFTDTALCSYLLGINDINTLISGPSLGNLFETMIIVDFLKRFHNAGEMLSMYYLKSRDGLEVDLVIKDQTKLHLFEIKSAMTITQKHTSSLRRLKSELGDQIGKMGIISAAENNFIIKDDIINFNWCDILTL